MCKSCVLRTEPKNAFLKKSILKWCLKEKSLENATTCNTKKEPENF